VFLLPFRPPPSITCRAYGGTHVLLHALLLLGAKQVDISTDPAGAGQSASEHPHRDVMAALHNKEPTTMCSASALWQAGRVKRPALLVLRCLLPIIKKIKRTYVRLLSSPRASHSTQRGHHTLIRCAQEEQEAGSGVLDDDGRKL
jgi:hypothetical protein